MLLLRIAEIIKLRCKNIQKVYMDNKNNDNLTDNIADKVIDGYIKPHLKHSRRRKGQINVNDDDRFSPDIGTGLSGDQIALRIAQGLTNEKEKTYSKTYFQIITSNLFTFFNLLCVLCVVALVVARERVLSNYFFVIVYAMNLIIGISQEIRAKISIEKLSILNQPTTTALRNGKLSKIPVTDVVLDDVIKVSVGDQICVDGTILKGYVEVNESMLTGESRPVKKKNGDVLLSGSYIVGGNAFIVADKVGEKRYIQRLSAKAKKYQSPHSELMITLNWIIKIIGILIVPITAGVLYTNYRAIAEHNNPLFYLNGKLTAEGIVQMVSSTTSVVIGMIPSGMLLLTTLALAVGVIRLANRHTSVQDMYSLEMLARVDVLCLDKTGTITDGRMQVTDYNLFDTTYEFTINDIVASMQAALGDNNTTARALKNYFGSTPKLIAKNIIPFSSEKKYSAVSFMSGMKDVGTFILGAPEFVFEGKGLNEAIAKQIDHYTSMGQRVLMLAKSDKMISDDRIPKNIEPFAIIMLSDNIRRDAIKTIEWFKKNDVAIKVISGDNPLTVSEVARRAGVDGADKFVSLEGLSKREVINIANKYNVFGRVTPDQKALLIKSMKSAGHTVAMTGDGVNDILAMKESDCSITVATGSDATKNIAHIVLMDNNFNSIPYVVGEGRRVINNIEKSSSLFLMKTIFTMVLAIVSIIGGNLFPFKSNMMTLLEFVVIGFGSFALSMQPNTNKVKGKFIGYLFSHALPGATILLFNVLAFQLIKSFGINFNEITPKMYDTLLVAALTFGGTAYFVIICKPYDMYKTIVTAIIMTSCFVLMVFVMPTLFKDLPNLLTGFKEGNWKFIAILICLIQFDSIIGKVMTFCFERINKFLEKNHVTVLSPLD